ncbi:hypothetical protein HDZ31DRAFT_68920, partial [Schizophyllum fasciatum]
MAAPACDRSPPALKRSSSPELHVAPHVVKRAANVPSRNMLKRKDPPSGDEAHGRAPASRRREHSPVRAHERERVEHERIDGREHVDAHPGKHVDRHSPNYDSRSSSTADRSPAACDRADARSSVACDRCGVRVPLRSPDSGELSMAAWEHHRAACRGPSAGASDGQAHPAHPAHPSYTPIIQAAHPAGLSNATHPTATAAPPSHPPTKRRRAKRTEDERIA